MADYLDGTAESNSFVLTFDDGYHDSFKVAMPILQRYSVPMHLFVTTGFVNGQVISWVDRVAQACSTAASKNYRIASLGLELRFSKPTGRYEGFDRLCSALKVMDIARIKEVLAEIEGLPGVIPLLNCDGLFLSASEIAAANSLVSFGAHSVTHANFRLLDRAAIAVEAEGSRRWLEAATGRPVHTFAYPYGFAGDCSYDYFHRALASPADSWRHVFGTGSGRAGDPLEDQRLNLNLQPFYVFHVEVSGALTLLRQALQR
jgi:peptidoglycan/xylan/chitin deacetylase (PgdA/CDA1 family)